MIRAVVFDWGGVLILVAWAYGGFAVVECLILGWGRVKETTARGPG